jgi:hypothetical protein
MGVRGKGEGTALFKGFPFPLPPAAGGIFSYSKRRAVMIETGSLGTSSKPW